MNKLRCGHLIGVVLASLLGSCKTVNQADSSEKFVRTYDVNGPTIGHIVNDGHHLTLVECGGLAKYNELNNVLKSGNTASQIGQALRNSGCTALFTNSSGIVFFDSTQIQKLKEHAKSACISDQRDNYVYKCHYNFDLLFTSTPEYQAPEDASRLRTYILSGYEAYEKNGR